MRTRREAMLSALAIFAAALAVRLLAAHAIPFGIPEDSAYYAAVARNLVAGHGLVSEAIWTYQAPLVLPHPAFETWLPLPSLLIAAAYLAFGVSFAAAQIVPVLAGAAGAVLVWRLAADYAAERGLPPARARALALGAGLAAASYLPLVLFAALPDSTALFTVLTLAFATLAARIVHDPRGVHPSDPRLLALGTSLGLAALTRSEAAWLALAWVILILRSPIMRAGGPGARIRAIAAPALVGAAVFAPWALRELATFGAPFPGSALLNALSVRETDISAFAYPPALETMLAQGPLWLVGVRLAALAHDLGEVLLAPGVPLSLIGLAGLTALARSAALRPLLLVAGLLLLGTDMLFPVATQSGTFLHDAGAVHALLLIGALAGLDSLVARAAALRHWARPPWALAATAAGIAALAVSAAFLPSFGAQAARTQASFAALPERMAAIGRPLGSDGPVITNHPVWLADLGAQALALPDEPPSSITGIARAFPGTRTVLVWGNLPDGWAEPSHCVEEIPLAPATGDIDSPRVFAITCP